MTHKIFRRPPWRPAPLALVAALAVAGCAVGPDFQSPAPPPVAEAGHPYTPAAMPAQTASAPGGTGTPQVFVDGQDIPAAWWEAFHAPALDELVRAAIAHSPSLAAAQATLREAKENYEADYGNRMLPAVTGQVGGERQKVALGAIGGAPTGTTYNVFSAQVDVSYTVDLFGANRRELESVAAQIDYQRFQVEAAYLSLSANVVATAIQEAALREQLQATRDVVEAEQKSLDLIERQAQLGAVAKSVVLQQRTLVAQTQAQLPALDKQLAQTRHQLAVLVGRLPGDGGMPEFRLDGLTLPHELPVSVPSALVRQRPDVRASEALLHQASADIGVATAALYPQVTLSGAVDRQSLKLDKLFSMGTTGWSLLGGIAQPIFNGGALHAKKRAAVAAYDAANAQYQETVLNAFLSVANALRAIDTDAEGLRAQAEAESLAKDSLDLVERQYRLGAVSYLASLDAQRTWLQTRVALAQARAARLADTAVLFQALGGGWWNAPDAVASLGADAASAPTH